MRYEHEELKCPYCGSTEIVFDPRDGVYVCARCGTVIGRVYYEGVETRPFDTALPRTSGSYTNTVHDHGVGSTTFDVSYKISVRDKYKWRNMRSLISKYRVTRKNRIIEKSLRHLNSYAKKLSIPDYVHETAAQLLRKTVDGKNYKDKTLRILALGSIYLALKIHGLHKPAKLFVKEVGITLSELWKAERMVRDANEGINTMMKKERPESYVSYIVNKLGLPNEVEILANRLIKEVRKLGLDVGKPAVGIATAAVYLASILLNKKKTQLEIAEVVGVSDVTIRNRYGEMIEALDIEVYI
jgi:transcription initiation factor TFIIB